MRLFQFDSLKTSTHKHIKEKCPQLLKANKKTILDRLADRRSGLGFVLMIYILPYLFCLFCTLPDCTKLNFIVLTKADALTFNTTNNGTLATVVGITMIVIGFIFTEVKSKSFVSFDFFSKKTFIFPILYSALANIASMLLISLFSSTIQSEVNFKNAVILGHYFILLNIALIVVIFMRVVTFMDYKPVFEAYKEAVLKIAANILYKEKTVELFDKKIETVLKQNKITETLSSFEQKAVLTSANTNGVLSDVYINKLEKEINNFRKSHPKVKFAHGQFLQGASINANATILYAHGDENIELKTIRVFKTDTKNDSEKTYKSYLENIDEQYINAVRNNNTTQAIDYLSIYEKLQNLYCETNQDLR